MTINRVAARQPGAPAVTMASGAGITFAELDCQSARLSNYWRSKGLVPGDRVALLMDNGLAYAICAWAARRSGLAAVPVNWQLSPGEVAYLIEDSDARALVASPRFRALAEHGLDGNPVAVLLSDGAEFGSFHAIAEAIESQARDEPPDQPDGAPMYYSSGTTGRPKGIRKNSGLRFGEQRPIERLYAQLYGLEAGSILLLPAPLYFSAPYGWMVAATALGVHVVLLDRFDAEGALAAVERHRVTHGLFVPTHFVRMLRLPKDLRGKYDLTSLRAAVHAGAPCAPDIKAAMIDWWGPVLHEYYSGSEGAGFTTITAQEWLDHPGSVGRSVLGAIHILDDEGRELPAGEIGTIWFEDAPRFEYHKAPDQTDAFFNAAGWGTLGDLGHVDDEGYLTIANRRADLIISGGANVYPQEIENAVAGHPAVLDVAAVAVADPEFGQAVRLLVVRQRGAAGDAELADELRGFCRSRLAGYKCPKSILFVPDLPRLASGKLLRRAISEIYRQP